MNTAFIRIDPDEKLVSTIVTACTAMRISEGAIVSGVGMLKHARMGFFRAELDRYDEIEHSGICDLSAVTGNITLNNKAVWPHVHAVFNDATLRTYSGHVIELTAHVTIEIFITVTQLGLSRSKIVGCPATRVLTQQERSALLDESGPLRELGTPSLRKHAFSTDEAPRPVARYSQAIRAGDMLFVQGVIALEPSSGRLVVGGIEAQTVRVFQSIEALLATARLGLADVVKVTVFLSTLSDYSAFNELYSQYFTSDPAPVRTTVQAALPFGALLEVEVVAHYGDQSDY